MEDKTLCKRSYLLGYADGQENKWIKCEDRMPEKEIDILIFDDGLVKFGIYSSDYCGDKFFTTNFEKWLKTTNVTHWMELPEAPNE